MAIGRPPKYNKKSLGAAVEKYFKSISRTEVIKQNGEPIVNDDGEEIRTTEYIIPPSISGLCLYLGIDRRTWSNYCDSKEHPEFARVTSYARARIEAYLEEQLLTRKKGLQGIIFNLQNNYNWTQKKEIELGEKTRKSAPMLSINEKLAIIAEAQAAMTGSAGECEEESGGNDDK